MKWLGKLAPYVVGASIGALGLYFFSPGQDEIKEKVTQMVETPTIELTEETEPEKIYCPPTPACPPAPKCPAPQVKYKTVYRDRIVHVPKVEEPGCRADWSTGTYSASTVEGTNLKCVYDAAKQKIKTYFSLPDGYNGTLRRGRP